jgi:hypothetical protein
MRTLVFRLWLRLVWEEELLMRKAIRLKEERELWSMA